MDDSFILCAFWHVQTAQMVCVHVPPFSWADRVPFIMGLKLGLQTGELSLPSPIFVIWTADDISISLLDGDSAIPQTISDSVKDKARELGFVFPRAERFN